MIKTVIQTIEVVASDPKVVSVVLVAASQVNVRWMEEFEPYIRDTTSIVGLIVLSLLAVKHTIDIYKSLSNKDN